jgi:hypothetical protein
MFFAQIPFECKKVKKGQRTISVQKHDSLFPTVMLKKHYEWRLPVRSATAFFGDKYFFHPLTVQHHYSSTLQNCMFSYFPFRSTSNRLQIVWDIVSGELRLKSNVELISKAKLETMCHEDINTDSSGMFMF